MPLITPPSSYAQDFHTKAFLWRGIYVLGNNDVPDEAVYRAAEIVFNSLAGVDQAIVDQLVAYDTRFAVIPVGTSITSLPDYDDLGPSWSAYRGLGGVPGRPTSSSGVENLIPGYPGDPYAHEESIGLHEWMHSIETIGLAKGNPALHAQFVAAYNHAVANHLWVNTYAHTDIHEYFAETAQAYFDNNPERAEPGDGIHNSINTRAELELYDPQVFALHQQLFGTSTWHVGDYYGSESNDSLYGTEGNDLILGNGGDDYLFGASGSDDLLGGAGSDRLQPRDGHDDLDGEAGNDTATFGDLGMRLDLVLKGSQASRYKLSGVDAGTIRNVENVEGSYSNDRITGDNKANQLAGGRGNDSLDGGKGKDLLDGGRGTDTVAGGLGSDTLTGGAKADKFVFKAALGAANVDIVTDFKHDADRLQLDDAIFTAIGPTLDDAEFYAAAGATAGHDKNDRIIYDLSTGDLYYDADGNKPGASIHFATLTNIPLLLDAGDISIV